MSDVDYYRSAIVKTFRERAIRTAHIIDDAFPTYRDLVTSTEAKERYGEWEIALELYDLFRKNHIPCDVENSVEGIEEDVERIRKSDLIVLDYNLAPNDTRMSISLVRELARTKHFNTIVVYTASENLDDVWLNFAVALRGGWSDRAEHQEAEAVLDELSDRDVVLTAPSRDLISAYIVGGDLQSSAPQDMQQYREVLMGAGVSRSLCSSVVEALIRREARRILKDDSKAKGAERCAVDGGCNAGRARWLQSGNCFVAIIGKRSGGAAVAGLFDALDEALNEWRPNLLQIIVSEIQNILEMDAIATDELHLRDPLTQVSLSYFLLSALSPVDNGRSSEGLVGPVHTLLDKLIDNVRQKLITDGELKLLGGNLLKSEIERLKIPTEFANATQQRAELFKFAKQMTGSREKQDAEQALLRFNSFLSTEPFRGELTTGTVFSDGDVQWICMTPACDMVDRLPDEHQEWRHQLHPTKPVVAVRLMPIPAAARMSALKVADQSRHVFVKVRDDICVYEMLPAKGPKYEFIFVDDGGRVITNNGAPRFQGARLLKSNGVRELKEFSFEVLGQVRANYASRLLQETGAWLSRIGVDFMRNAI